MSSHLQGHCLFLSVYTKLNKVHERRSRNEKPWQQEASDLSKLDKSFLGTDR
jgi:hypothetical protein